jgi:hypothetical protein
MACGEEVCTGLVFGAAEGILNATLTANAEIMRHEIGTENGLRCDCEAVMRATKQIRMSSELNNDAKPLVFSAAGFDVSGTAMLTSYECTWSREAFVQHTSTYELVEDMKCGDPEDVDTADVQSCPGWSTQGDVVNATYTMNVEVLKYEEKDGNGSAGSPLIKVKGVFTLRKRFTLSVTFDRDPGDVEAGDRHLLKVSSADGSISVSKEGILTSVERTCQKEGWTTWTLVVEGIEPDCNG